jgi:hypothetical protein
MIDPLVASKIREEVTILAEIRQPTENPVIFAEDGTPIEFDCQKQLCTSSQASMLVACMEDALRYSKSIKQLALSKNKTDNLKTNRMLAVRYLTGGTEESTKELTWGMAQVLIDRWSQGFKANSLAIYEVPILRDEWLAEHQEVIVLKWAGEE